jgi:hypothetical protein
LHASHAVEADAAWDVPTAQLVHSALPVALAYRPAAQLAHCVDATAPATGWARPAAQLVQLVIPVATA